MEKYTIFKKIAELLDNTIDIASNWRYNTYITNNNNTQGITTMTDIQKCELIANTVANEKIESAFVRDLLIQKMLKANDLQATNEIISFIENLLENHNN
jgi:hypothetical protein